MPSPPDRKPGLLEIDWAYPCPPINVFCMSAFRPSTLDIRWSDPTQLNINSKWNILGVNIYRSFDSEYGPWIRLNDLPVGATYYRDRTTVTVAIQENAGAGFPDGIPPLNGDGEYVITTINKPIYLQPTIGDGDCTALNAQVTINGQMVWVTSIDPQNGTITVNPYPAFDVINQLVGNGNLATPGSGPNGGPPEILVTYKYDDNAFTTALDARIFYKVTTVGSDIKTGEILETPLERATTVNNRQIEKLDYIWTEAIRRQRWLLEHGGERVKVFIHKVNGTKCGCINQTSKQPQSDCPLCFGMGILGGYDGPFDILISPDDGEKSTVQTNLGRSLSHPYDTWTLPTPLLSQLDFLVKLNGDRYGIGGVRMPSNRGMQLAQFFELGHLDSGDIRYKVPVIDPLSMMFPQTRYIIPGRGDATPMISERENIPDEREYRGTSVTWENTQRK